jgi:type I restriction enzyme R subunit
MDLNESGTRALLINPQLEKAEWNLSDRAQVRFEVPVSGYDPTPWNGFTDFCLYDASGQVLAVIEAKRTAREPREGEEQLRQYVTEIARNQPFAPFGFMTNGLRRYFWEVGLAHPREVAGFFSPKDLRRLHFIRQNQTPLSDHAINTNIVERAYQHEAIRRAAEVFATGERRALLVMATGTGKTRTTMALIDLFLRSSSAQKILFIADRDALVEQALNDGFKAFLPNEPRARIHTANIDTDKRLYVSTLQTMGRCYEKFSPGFFDLIIFDEAHRSIFNRFTEVIEYFDARMIGLTATPAAFIDRNTFRVFHCRDQAPTFLYTYEQAQKDKVLVPFRLWQAQTGFQRDGIRGADLTEEERDLLIAQGIDPDNLDYSGTDIEVLVSNRDTLRRQWEEIWNICIKDAGGNLPGKTIIFAMTKAHAGRIREVFEEMFPPYVDCLQLVYDGMERVHDGSYGDGLISKFKKNDKPRIAVSVDMLDTGVDIPEVVNLVFMKPVQSRIKLWQMIGRGTRNNATCRFHDRLPNREKTEFLIIDFWQNDFGRQTEDRVPTEVPLLIRLFNTRLDILAATINDRNGIAHKQSLSDCRSMLQRVPIDAFLVRKEWERIGNAWNNDFWHYLTGDKINFLRMIVAPMLRFVPDVDVPAETFTHKIERLNLQVIQRNTRPDLLQSIADEVVRLPQYVHENPSNTASIGLVLSQDLAQADPVQLKKIVLDLAGEMKNKRRDESSFLKIDLPDYMAGRGFILIGPSTQPIHVEEYRRRVEQRILATTENHPALMAIREGRQPDDDQLVDLERLLQNELSSADVGLSPTVARQAYGINLNKRVGFLGFLRGVLELDAIPDYETVVAHSFQLHISSHNYSGDQIRFLRSVQDVFLEKRRLSEADLYQAPSLTTFGRNAVERFFTQQEIRELITMTDRLAA